MPSIRTSNIPCPTGTPSLHWRPSTRGAGFLKIEGKRSEFVGPAPWELGETKDYWDAKTLTAGVANWKMPL